MRYKKLSNTNISCLTIGSMGIGAENFNDTVSQEFIESVRMLVEQGVNLIDTAPRYGNGTSEKIVGRAIKNIRDKVLIASKFGSYKAVGRFDVRDATYASIMRECENSRLNLGIDCIDIYINHWPDPHTPIEETMAALNQLKAKGAIKYIGFSNCDQALLEEALKYGNVDILQCQFSLASQKNRDLMRWAKSKGIMVMTYGSLGSGILSGNIRTREDIAKKNHLALYEFFQEPAFSNIMKLMNHLDTIAAKYQVPVSQVAINWSTGQNYVDTAVIGINSPGHALENAQAFQWQLTPEEIETISAEAKRLNIQ